MKSVAMIAALLLFLAMPARASEEARSPVRHAVPEKASGAASEGAQTQLFMRGVEADLTTTTATIRIGALSSTRSQTTGPLRLELWATRLPPVFGEAIQPRIVATANLPFVLQGGETRRDYTTGPVPGNPPTQGAFYLSLALLEFSASADRFVYAELFTLPGQRKFGPALIVTGMPRGLFQRIGSGGAIDDFYVSNVGTAVATVQIDQSGDFFAMAPTTFVVAPGGRERVRLVAGSRSEGFYKGEAIVNANGQQVYSVPIRLLAANPPSGEVKPRSLTRRIDVSGASSAQPRGQVTFTNSGSATLKGILLSDATWLIPDDGLVTIPPGGSATVGFTCRREFRPDDSLPGVSASLSLAYVLGMSSATARSTLDTPPTSLATVVVTDTSQPTTASGVIPPLAQGEVAVMIPGVRHLVEGSREIVSDMSIVNGVLGTTVGDLSLYFSSASSSKSAPTTAIAPTQSLNLADVVTGYFGETAEVGTIQVRSSSLSSLSIAANVLDRSNASGTYGTAIPVFRSDRAAAQGQRLVISGLKQDAAATTRLFLQETTGSAPAVASIDFFDVDGAKVGSTSSPEVPAFGLGLVESAVPAGAVSAIVTPTAGTLVAYATPTDTASGDAWAVTDWSRQFELTGSERSIVPVAGFVAGMNDSLFHTDLSVTNSGASRATIKLVYHPSSGESVIDTLDLDPNESEVLEDVVPGFFNVSGHSVGWISVEPVGGAFAVASRTYTRAADDPATFGTGVAVVSPSVGLAAGESRVFGGLEDSTTATVVARQGGTFRTNVGLIEISGREATARVSVYFATGIELAVGGAVAKKDFAIPPNGYLALNGIVRQIVGDSRETDYPDLHGVSVKVDVVDGEGSIIPFVSMTDNGTNDTVLRIE